VAGTDYWLALYNVKTWDDFVKAGEQVTGFRQRYWSFVRQIKPKDYLVCYLTGVSRFVGALEVTSDPYLDTSRVDAWSEQEFPCRIKVKPLVTLSSVTAVPILDLKGELSYFSNQKSTNAWASYFRRSPARMKEADGKVVIDALKKAKAAPIFRPLDKQKVSRSLRYKHWV
jgi:predicted RNA-binding protein